MEDPVILTKAYKDKIQYVIIEELLHVDSRFAWSHNSL